MHSSRRTRAPAEACRPVSWSRSRLSRSITPHHNTPRHATPRRAAPRRATPLRATPRHSTPRHAAPRRATSRRAAPHHATSRRATLRRVTLLLNSVQRSQNPPPLTSPGIKGVARYSDRGAHRPTSLPSHPRDDARLLQAQRTFPYAHDSPGQLIVRVLCAPGASQALCLPGILRTKIWRAIAFASAQAGQLAAVAGAVQRTHGRRLQGARHCDSR